VLEPAVLDQAAPDRRDLRLLDTAGRPVPYILDPRSTKAVGGVTEKGVRLIDYTYSPSKYTRVVLDFGGPVEKDGIRVSTDGRRFCRRVTLEGGHDNRNWERVLEDAWLVRLENAGPPVHADTVEFPNNTFRYLRLTVFNAPGDPERLHIGKARYKLPPALIERNSVPMSLTMTAITNDAESNETVCNLDVGYRHVPIMKLGLQIEDAYFHRSYVLRGRNAETLDESDHTDTRLHPAKLEAPWRTLRTGSLYRIQHPTGASESLTIKECTAPYRYLQVRIFNGDSSPLSISRDVSTAYRDAGLIFERRPGTQYTLYFGNPAAHAPSYDLGRAVSGFDYQTLPRARTGGIEAVEGHGPKGPWTERQDWLVWLALVLVVAAMVGLVFMNIKRVRDAENT